MPVHIGFKANQARTALPTNRQPYSFCDLKMAVAVLPCSAPIRFVLRAEQIWFLPGMREATSWHLEVMTIPHV